VVQALDESGKVLVTYPATMGSEHDPLPIGDWKIADVQKMPYFHYNASLFWDAKNKNETAVLKPGPNSPVGVVWMGLTKEHYGIHGTENPHTIGHTQSHGCIRLTNWDAMELAGMVSKGTPVVLKEN
jgi:lipoprotein-anchoring transpeptidase ErfK/SrfK